MMRRFHLHVMGMIGLCAVVTFALAPCPSHATAAITPRLFANTPAALASLCGFTCD